LVLLGVFLAGLTGAVMVLPLLPTDRVTLDVGGVAGEDIHAPRRITYESDLLRAEAQESAAASVEPVYSTPDPALARQQLDRARQVLDFLGAVRADTVASTSEQEAWIVAVPELVDLSTDNLDSILALTDDGWDRVQLETLAVIDQAMRKVIREGHLDEMYQDLPTYVGLDLSVEEAAVTAVLAGSFLVPNSFLDPEATQLAQERARENVSSVLRLFEADEIIVREGQRVTELEIEALDQFGLRQSEVEWQDFIDPGIMSAFGTVLLFAFLGRFQPRVLWDRRQIVLLVLLTALFVVGARLMVPSEGVLRYLFPASALAMLVVTSIGPEAAVAVSVYLGAAAGVIADGSLEVIAYVSAGGVIATLTLNNVDHVAALFRAGACVILGDLVVLSVFHIQSMQSEPVELAIMAVSAIANGGISASLALGGLFLIAPLFDVITTMRLIELSRPDRPLLQRMLREAPATYHHSLMVANLAEQAAERIGANALLTRVGAYYHDIGKLMRPYFYAENQVEGVNPHDELEPFASASIILSHVEDGLDLARRYRLPARIKDFIPQHHGTTWVSFFYKRAVEIAGDASLVDEDAFRYSGPKPQVKETALVMLADGCEAAVRSMHPPNRETSAKIINSVIDERVADSQLSECDLTLHDLETVREVFVSTLRGIYHPRITYPDLRSSSPPGASKLAERADA
jgi:putative nucleotidyltransferase with HDIG domain